MPTFARPQRLRGGLDLRGLRMLLREVAEEHRGVFPAFENFSECSQRARKLRRRNDLLAGDRHQPVVVHRMQHVDLRAALGGLAQAMRDQRMVLAQERADDQHAVELLQLGDRHAEPRNSVELARKSRCAAGGNRRERPVWRPGTVLPASNAATPARRSSPLRCGTRTSNACSQSTSCHWPSRFTIGRCRRSGGVEALVGEAVLVGQPALVDRLVLERQHAHHAVLLHLHHQVRAERVVRRDRAAPRQLPGARLVAERLGGQRAHRAEVDHVARELGVDRAVADERHDLGVLAAPGEAELHDAADLLAEAHAARALDAAAHFLGRDQRTELLPQDDALFSSV